MVLAALVLAGCQPQQPSTNNPSSNPNQKVRLVWWGTVHSEAVMQPLIDEYQSINPNVTIDYSTSRWNKTASSASAATSYRQELDRTLASGSDINIPDIFSADATWVGALRKHISPVPSNLYTPQKFRETFLSASADLLVIKDPTTNAEVVTALPDHIETYALVYNSRMLATAGPQLRIPTGWSEFKTVARQMTIVGVGSAITQAGFAGGYGDNIEFGPKILSLLMMQNGVRLADATGLPSFATASLNDANGAVTFYKSFSNESPKTWVTDKNTYKNDSANFLEGKVASIIVPSWRYRQILDQNQKRNLGLEIKTAKIPQLAGQTSEVYWGDHYVNLVSVKRPNANIAWAFLDWLSQPEQQRKLSNNTKNVLGFFGLLSPQRSMANDMVADQYLTDYATMLPNARSWAMIDGQIVDAAFRTLLNRTSSNNELPSVENQLRSALTQKLNQ